VLGVATFRVTAAGGLPVEWLWCHLVTFGATAWSPSGEASWTSRARLLPQACRSSRCRRRTWR
jgi:hypothetical protein